MQFIACRNPFKRKGIGKMLLMIKLTIILSIATCLHASAEGFSQTISLSEKDASLEKVFLKIKKQTGYTFAYTKALLQKSVPVNLNVHKASLDEVLRTCLKDQPFDYTIVNKTVVLINKKEPVIVKEETPLPPPVTVNGKVYGDKGVPLAGATVTEKGVNNVTVTKEDGSFTITVGSDKAILVVSYVGYGTKEMAVAGKENNLVIELTVSVESAESIVIVGYGSQKRSTLTGSVSTVAGSDVVKSPSPNVASSLQGRLPGLIANQRTGTPGRDDPNILIRGTGSVPPPGASYNDLLALNAPLVIIDGVPRDNMGRLNPQDIESISVLKDGSAAIYGARAANGVILVTTKSGSRGKADFTLSYNYAINSPTKIPDVLDAATFAEVYNEGAFYRADRNPANYTPQYTDEQIQKMRDGSDPNQNPNTDWVGVMLHNSYVKNLNFQVNGGNEKVRYLLSFGSLQQNGNFHGNTMLYKQYNFRAKIDIELAENLHVGANISGILKDGRYPGRTGTDPGGNIDFTGILGANPTLVAIYPNGLIGPGRLNQNALLQDQMGYHRDADNPLFSTFTASYAVPFVKGLKMDASFNYDLRNMFTKIWETPYFYYEYNAGTGGYDKKKGTGISNPNLTDRYSKWTTMLTNFRLSYNRTFLHDHHITAMFGWEQQRNSFSTAGATRRNFLSPAIDQLDQGSTAADDQGVGGTASRSAYNNYFGRINYDYQSKYLLEFLFRYDGSQIFPENKRYGFFPGVSAGWRLSEEDFIRTALPFVNQLKLRVSYGELGNDRVGAFNYLQSFFIGQNYVFGTTDAPGIYASLLANSNITWERARKIDFGLEAQLWGGKLGIDFTWWLQKRNNILYRRNLSVPTTFGFPTLPYENIGKVNSHGFELVLNNRGNIGRITYHLSGNVAYNINKAVFLDEVPPAEDYQKLTGMPVFTGLYYKADGIFKSQEELDKYPHDPNTQIGDIRVVDLNGDGKIDADDRYRVPYTTVPKYVFGLNSNFQFKNFDLNIFFQGQAGVRNYDDRAAALGETDFTNATVWRATDRWSASNPNGSKPRATAYQPGNTTFFLFDASFVRLKTVELGYNIPASVLARTRFLKNIRVYVSAFNLATWAAEIKWADPEFNGSYFNYPPSRVINFGASIKF
jgi:TonB-linked SusC/RagA family outer membrane protein